MTMPIFKRSIFSILIRFCLIILFFHLSHIACAQVDYYEELQSEGQFITLQSQPLTQKFSNTKAVKVIYDIQHERLFFTNSSKYRYHHDFCREVLRNNPDVTEFNYRNYRASNMRQYILGTINYYEDQQVYALEFATTERFSKDNIRLYDMIVKRAYIGENLYLNPITERQMDYVRNIPKPPPIITSNELYNGVRYQLLVPGSKISRLRKIDIKDLKNAQLQASDIVLTNGSPNEIDLCAGLIITRFQSPLSHINVLCQNRKTPVLALKTAYEDYDGLNNQYVRFTVTTNHFILEKVTEQRFLDFEKNNKRVRLKKLSWDTASYMLLPIDRLQKRHITSYGGKATNTAELYKISRLRKYCQLPENAFAIPLVYYVRHAKRSGADKTNRITHSIRF